MRADRFQFGAKVLYEALQRPLDMLFVALFVGLEPGAVVVLPQLDQEFEQLGAKVSVQSDGNSLPGAPTGRPRWDPVRSIGLTAMSDG